MKKNTLPSKVTGLFIHDSAIVEDGSVLGEKTRVWAFTHILPRARIGAECNVCDHVFIENDVIIGDRVTIKCGVHLWDGLRIENDVFIGPSAVFTNDMRPRSKQYPAEFLITILKEGCSIGANATILPGLTIGRWAMVAAGSVVTHNVSDHQIVAGNPAHFHGWACNCGNKLEFNSQSDTQCGCGRFFNKIKPDKIEMFNEHK